MYVIAAHILRRVWQPWPIKPAPTRDGGFASPFIFGTTIRAEKTALQRSQPPHHTRELRTVRVMYRQSCTANVDVCGVEPQYVETAQQSEQS